MLEEIITTEVHRWDGGQDSRE